MKEIAGYSPATCIVFIEAAFDWTEIATGSPEIAADTPELRIYQKEMADNTLEYPIHSRGMV